MRKNVIHLQNLDTLGILKLIRLRLILKSKQVKYYFKDNANYIGLEETGDTLNLRYELFYKGIYTV